MTLDWTCPAPRGYLPKLSWPWLAHGLRRDLSFTNLLTGETTLLGIDAYAHGWMSPSVLRCTRLLEDDNQRRVGDLYPPSLVLAEDDDTVWTGLLEVRASHGHWAAWTTASEILYDGRVIGTGYHGVRQDGEWVAARHVASEHALHVFRAGVLDLRGDDGEIPKQCEAFDWAIGPSGVVVYGYPKVWAAWPDGRQEDVTRSPWGEGATGGGGFCLIDVAGETWLWSCGQIAPGQWGVLGGVLGQPEVIALDLEAATLDVQVVGSDFIVAASDARGNGRAIAVPIASERRRLKAPTPPPPEASISLDVTDGPVPLTVTARLTHRNLTTWRWLLNDTIVGSDSDTHVSRLTEPGRYRVGLRTLPPTAVDDVVVTATASTRLFYGMGTGGAKDDRDCEALASNGWGRVRVEGTDYTGIMQMCHRWGFRPCWIIWPEQAALVPSEIDVELYNEPDIGVKPWPKLSPAAYREQLLKVWPILKAKGCVLWAGSVSNVSPDALAWLAEMLQGVPDEVNVAIHRYPDTGQRDAGPRKPYVLRSDEARVVRVVTKKRLVAVTESGRHQAAQSKYKGLLAWLGIGRFSLSDQEQADLVAADFAAYQAAGFAWACDYQWSDGGGSGALDHFGTRRMNGTFKPKLSVPLRGM